MDLHNHGAFGSGSSTRTKLRLNVPWLNEERLCMLQVDHLMRNSKLLDRLLFPYTTFSLSFLLLLASCRFVPVLIVFALCLLCIVLVWSCDSVNLLWGMVVDRRCDEERVLQERCFASPSVSKWVLTTCLALVVSILNVAIYSCSICTCGLKYQSGEGERQWKGGQISGWRT